MDISFYPPDVPPPGGDIPVPPDGTFYEFMYQTSATINADGDVDPMAFTMGAVQGNGFELDNVGTYVLSENGGGFIYQYSPPGEYEISMFPVVPDGGFDPGTWTFRIEDLGPGDQITVATGSISYCGVCDIDSPSSNTNLDG